MDDVVLTATADKRQWVDAAESGFWLNLLESVTHAELGVAIADIEGASVASITPNHTGVFDSPGGRLTGLPNYKDVRINIPLGGGHVAEVVLWVPEKWNQRFLGVGGGGNRTTPQWVPSAYGVVPTLLDGVRNGFAVAFTNAGNTDPRFAAWGLKLDTRDIDWVLARNWHHLGTHQMTIVCKAAIAALYGEGPKYSYLVGSSGGGRQILVHAQRYPAEYDGYWAECPAINWSHFHVAQMWPPVVMNDLANPLQPAKLEAFRQGAIRAFDARDGVEDGLISSGEFISWDPNEIIGQETAAGLITPLDAEVMELIWRGPASRAGERLWYGLPVGAESWGENIMGLGLLQTELRDGELVPRPFNMSYDWIGSWVLRDPDWDWTTLTMETFEEVFNRSVTEFAELDSSDPDYSGLHVSGGKLLLTHGMWDELIPAQGTVRFYERMVDAVGGPDSAREFVRFFLPPGMGHAGIVGGPGIDIVAGMTALMEWVEDGIEPDVVPGTRISADTLEVDMTRPICAYPATARYIGGDATSATSFEVGESVAI